jgi:hypothetical protein
VCSEVFHISPDKETEVERERLRDAIPLERGTQAAKDYADLTEYLAGLKSSATRDIKPPIGQEIFWIKSIASWKKQYKVPTESQATRQQEER